jgi:hypothetical protein
VSPNVLAFVRSQVPSSSPVWLCTETNHPLEMILPQEGTARVGLTGFDSRTWAGKYETSPLPSALLRQACFRKGMNHAQFTPPALSRGRSSARRILSPAPTTT